MVDSLTIFQGEGSNISLNEPCNCLSVGNMSFMEKVDASPGSAAKNIITSSKEVIYFGGCLCQSVFAYFQNNFFQEKSTMTQGIDE